MEQTQDLNASLRHWGIGSIQNAARILAENNFGNESEILEALKSGNYKSPALAKVFDAVPEAARQNPHLCKMLGFPVPS